MNSITILVQIGNEDRFLSAHVLQPGDMLAGTCKDQYGNEYPTNNWKDQFYEAIRNYKNRMELA